MKQMSEVETTTSSRPALPTVLMGSPVVGVKKRLAFIIREPDASRQARPPRHRLLRSTSDQRGAGARGRGRPAADHPGPLGRRRPVRLRPGPLRRRRRRRRPRAARRRARRDAASWTSAPGWGAGPLPGPPAPLPAWSALELHAGRAASAARLDARRRAHGRGSSSCAATRPRSRFARTPSTPASARRASCTSPTSRAVLCECRRVLVPGGRLAFTDWIAHPRLGDGERERDSGNGWRRRPSRRSTAIGP